MPGSLNGEPGEELELPGTAPPAASMSWQDWLGRPVPLGLPAANAGAAPATMSIPARTPAVIAARMMDLLWLPTGGRTSTTNNHEQRPAPVHDRPDFASIGRRRPYAQVIPPRESSAIQRPQFGDPVNASGRLTGHIRSDLRGRRLAASDR